MPYTASGQWYPGATTTGAPGSPGMSAVEQAYRLQQANNPSPQDRTQQAGADIAQGTAAGTYHAPASQAEQAAAGLAQAQLAETTRSNRASEDASAASRAEATRAAQAGEALGGSTLAETTRANQAGEKLSGQKEAFTENSETQRHAMLQGLLDTIQKGGSPITPIDPNGGAGGGGRLTNGGASPMEATLTTNDPAAPQEGTLTTNDPVAPGGGAGVGVPPASTGSPMSPYDMAAENAAYGTAKEHTGNEAQAALKGLRATMAQRGIGGSGIEASNTRGIFEGALGEQANTDRSLAENRANRVYGAEQSNKAAAEERRKFDLTFRQSEQSRIANEQSQRLAALLQAAGLY